MSKRFYPEPYDKQADKLINNALLAAIIIGVIAVAAFLGIYCIGL